MDRRVFTSIRHTPSTPPPTTTRHNPYIAPTRSRVLAPSSSAKLCKADDSAVFTASHDLRISRQISSSSSPTVSSSSPTPRHSPTPPFPPAPSLPLRTLLLRSAPAAHLGEGNVPLAEPGLPLRVAQPDICRFRGRLDRPMRDGHAGTSPYAGTSRGKQRSDDKKLGSRLPHRLQRVREGRGANGTPTSQRGRQDTSGQLGQAPWKPHQGGCDSSSSPASGCRNTRAIPGRAAASSGAVPGHTSLEEHVPGNSRDRPGQ